VAIAFHKLSFRSGKSAKGFTMIEILVTSLILSIGLLGIASLQTLALSGSLDSAQRGKAIWLDQELLERLKANLASAVLHNGLVAAVSQEHSAIRNDYVDVSQCTGAPLKYCSDWASGSGSKENGEFCSSRELAAFDQWEVACGYSYNERVVDHDPDRVKTNIVDFMGESTLTLECVDGNATDADDCSRHSDFIVTATWNGKGEGIREQRLEFTVRP